MVAGLPKMKNSKAIRSGFGLVLLAFVVVALLWGDAKESRVFGSSPAPMRGDAIWILSDEVLGNESQVVNNLKAHNIKAVFIMPQNYSRHDNLWLFAEFIRQAHANNITVHAVTFASSDGSVPDVSEVQQSIEAVVAYNATNPDAKFDGVQLDIENTSAHELYELFRELKVPADLVFSAAVQFYGHSSRFLDLLSDTDLDVLIPMLYIMDFQAYQNGSPVFPAFSLINLNTVLTLARIGDFGYMLTGLSSYDRQIILPKNFSGNIWGQLEAKGGRLIDMPAFDPTNRYSVPQLVWSGRELVSVTYYPHSGVSVYRFKWSPTEVIDVIETTPLGLRLAMDAANKEAGNRQYLGTALWKYETTFDAYSARSAGLLADDNIHPAPQVDVQIVSRSAGEVILRVTLKNANPSEAALGDRWGSGVHLRLEGEASFVSARRGDFHGITALDSRGKETELNGSKIVELTKWFFLPGSSGVTSGDIVIRANRPFVLKYRGWIKDKDSGVLNPDNANAIEPYVARFPADHNYDKHLYDSSFSFLSYRTAQLEINPLEP